MKVKKLTPIIMSALLATSISATTPITTSSAAVNDVNYQILLGDVNGDNYISNTDALYIQRYLLGLSNPTAIQFTSMDYNEDGIVDQTDATSIMSDIAYASVSYARVTKPLYMPPDNSSRTYRKHYCSSSSGTSYSSYTISAATANTLNNNILGVPMLASDVDSSDTIDNDNICCVSVYSTMYDGKRLFKSGVIVDNHVIATAASNLYQEGQFAKDVTIYVYSGNCLSTLATATAKTIHIPSSYITSHSDTYDYGLIYVDEDLGSYKADIGVMTDQFKINPNNELGTSGLNVNYGVRRRFNTFGNIIPNSNHYTFKTSANCPPDKNGGMIFYQSSRGNIHHNSYVGSAIAKDPYTDTYGVRITPTLLRFFFQNNYLY